MSRRGRRAIPLAQRVPVVSRGVPVRGFLVRQQAQPGQYVPEGGNIVRLRFRFKKRSSLKRLLDLHIPKYRRTNKPGTQFLADLIRISRKLNLVRGEYIKCNRAFFKIFRKKKVRLDHLMVESRPHLTIVERPPAVIRTERSSYERTGRRHRRRRLVQS